jgi:hypothetical protein
MGPVSRGCANKALTVIGALDAPNHSVSSDRRLESDNVERADDQPSLIPAKAGIQER